MKQSLQICSKCLQGSVISERIVYFSSPLQSSGGKMSWVSEDPQSISAEVRRQRCRPVLTNVFHNHS